MLEYYKFEYVWMDSSGKISIEHIKVLAVSEEDARNILNRMCTDKDRVFTLGYS